MTKLTGWLWLGVLLIVVSWPLFTAWKYYRIVSELDAARAPNKSFRGEAAVQALRSYSFTSVHSDENIIVNDLAFFWEGGTFNGTNAFWAYQCDSIEGCWNTLLSENSLARLTRDEFHPYVMPEIQILREGPWDKSVAEEWTIREIQNGAYSLRILRENFLYFWAIDFDTKMVYGSYQSGHDFSGHVR